MKLDCIPCCDSGTKFFYRVFSKAKKIFVLILINIFMCDISRETIKIVLEKVVAPQKLL